MECKKAELDQTYLLHCNRSTLSKRAKHDVKHVVHLRFIPPSSSADIPRTSTAHASTRPGNKGSTGPLRGAARPIGEQDLGRTQRH
eukprot:5739347-Amphidinium_carterae.1